VDAVFEDLRGLGNRSRNGALRLPIAVPEPLRWRSWAADPEGITGDQLLGFVNNTLFPGLKELKVYGTDPRAHVGRSK